MKAYRNTIGGTVKQDGVGVLGRFLMLLGALFLAAVLCLILTGCGQSPEGTTAAVDETMPTDGEADNPVERYAVQLPEGVVPAGDPVSETVYRIALCASAEDPLAEDIANRFQSRLDEIGREQHVVFALSAEYFGPDVVADGYPWAANPWAALRFTTAHGAVSEAVSRLPDGSADLLAGIGTVAASAMKDEADRIHKTAPEKSADTAGGTEQTDTAPGAQPDADSIVPDADTIAPDADSIAQPDADSAAPDADSIAQTDSDSGTQTEEAGLSVIFTDVRVPLPLTGADSADPAMVAEDLRAEDYVFSVSVSLDAEMAVKALLALEPEARKVGLLYNPEDEASAPVVSRAVALFQDHGVELVERTGTTADEIQLAAQALAEDKVDAVFTPDDAAVLAAEDIVSGVLTAAGIPHYAASTAFAKAGAFLGYGADPAALGRELANLAAAILLDGGAEDSGTVEPTAAVNGKACAVLGRDIAAVLGTLESLVPALVVS